MSDFVTAVPVSERVKIASAPYTPGRLRRASRLWVQRTDNPNEFFVQSDSHPDTPRAVKLDARPMCYCEDHENTTEQCSHVLAARLARGDMTLVQALGNILFAAEKNLKEHLRKNRRKASSV